jgi:hypothetical protein
MRVNDRIAALLIIAQARAEPSDRDVLTLPDLPITKGLQERIRAGCSASRTAALTRGQIACRV